MPRVLARRPEPGPATLGTACGACALYALSGHCQAHELLGPKAKPAACREFPFRYREAPDGSGEAWVGLSFACPSVRGNLGASLADQSRQLAGDFPAARGRAVVGESGLRLSPGLGMAWRHALALEGAFDSILSSREEPLEARLAACAALLDLLEAYAAHSAGARGLGRSGDPFLPDKDLDDFLSAMRRSGFSEPRQAARRLMKAGERRRINRVATRMLVGLVAGFVDDLLARPGPLAAILRASRRAAGLAMGIGSPGLPGVAAEQVPAVKALGRSRLPAAGEPGHELVERWLRHRVFRKDLLQAPTLARGLRLMMLDAALLRWYAAAVAGRGGQADSAAPTAEHWSEAVGLAEKYFGFHSRWTQVLGQYPTLERLVDRSIDRRAYPFTILA